MTQLQTTHWELKRVIPQVVSMLALMAIFNFLLPAENKGSSVYYAVMCYLLYSVISRHLILTFHRKGTKALHREKHEEALALFTKSKQFFERYSWLDKYRYFTMMSPSSFSYKEIAMMNIAFTYSQQEKFDLTKKAYVELLEEYPNNIVATNAMKLIEDAKKNSPGIRGVEIHN